MALARIITHSQACSRELALDLLARGYAVEIVSPDSIPDNIADLELRVDTAPGEQLIASVKAHHGERSASLEFVHHLKAPMVDFIRRPPEPRESAHPPEEPVIVNTGPNVEAVELPEEAPQPAPKAVSPAADVLPAPELDREEGARLISPPEPLPSVPVEPPSACAVEATTIARPTPLEPTTVEATLVETTLVETTPVEPREKPQPPDRPTGWRWRAALIFASVVLLALVLGLGMRRTGKASAQGSAAAPTENIAPASTDVGLSSGAIPERDPQKDPGQVLAVPVPPPAAPSIRSEGNSNHAPEESPVVKAGAATASTAKSPIAKASTAKPSTTKASIVKVSIAKPSTAKASTAKPSTAKAEAMTSHRLGAEIARDTVTYFDERASNETALRAKPAKRFARQHQRSGKYNGGVIAANKVTYFDKKPAPKAANRNSGVKRQSEPN
jgi:hypothetical protein